MAAGGGHLSGPRQLLADTTPGKSVVSPAGNNSTTHSAGIGSLQALDTVNRRQRSVLSDSIHAGLHRSIAARISTGRKPTIDLFVMSQCPFGVLAEQTMADVLKAFPGQVEFRLNFIASVSMDGVSIQSMHGQPEIDENIRQLIIARDHPDRLLPYLVLRAKNYLSSNWQVAAQMVGLDTMRIEQAFNTSASMQLLRDNIKRAQVAGITASPTLLIDGVKYSGRLIDPTPDAATQCQTGTDPYTGSAYVVCTATPTYAWITSSAPGGGQFHPLVICQSLGYSGIGQYGGTCGSVCGYCTSGTSCSSPQPTTTFDGNGNQGTDQYGLVIGNTVHWECVGAGCPTITVTNPTTSTGTLGIAFNESFTAAGGSGAYTYSTTSTLPTGLTLSAAGVLSGTPTQTGTFSITVVATDANTCTGTSATYVLVISCPTVSVNPVTAQQVCNGQLVNSIVFSGTPAGVVYSWTNSNASIGLAASGTGNIPAFTATNTGATTKIGSIQVTPTYTFAGTSCTGPVMTFAILVSPTANVNPIANQVLCVGDPTSAINFTGNVTGTTFNWTNNNPSIGLAASGTGSIPSFITTNATNAPITATITVTPSSPAGGQTGISYPYSGGPQTYTVPPGITTVTIQATGAAGGNGTFQGNYGAVLSKGGFAKGDLQVTPGQVLNVFVGGQGQEYTQDGEGGGGYNGGGNGKTILSYGNGTRSGGGGASDVRVNGTSLADRVIVAGGGGGTCCTNDTRAGDGGGLTGGDGIAPSIQTGIQGTGGSQTLGGVSLIAPGSFDGTFGTGGSSGGVNTVCGGGGGYYGGGAGVGAGGGSSYIGGVSNASTLPGINTGHGNVYISYIIPSTSCPGPTQTFTITVNPTPSVNAVNNQTLCNGANVSAINFSGPVTGTVYSWTNSNPSIGLAASGTGNIASFLATNSGTTPITATITVTPSFTNAGVTCTGTPKTFTITVNPIPSVNAVNDQTLCVGSTVSAINFNGPITGTIYNWTNSNPSIGLAASGTGNIAAFPATNTGTTPITATITVTPSFTNAGGTCTGTPKTISITVNPIPSVNAVNNQTLCKGANVSAINFSGPVTGTIYSWTNDNPAIGLAASGTGNIASFLATNTGSTPISATITVTPSFTTGATCTGTPKTFTITVNPTPTVNPVPDERVCTGAPFTAITFSGSVPGTVYTWTNSNPSIGLAASGTGNIPSFNGINTGATFQTAIVTVTPSYTNGGVTCTGTPFSFALFVNPSPTVNAIPNQLLCHGTNTNAINFTGGFPGTNYNWTNNTPSIGLAASGTGNIPAFTVTNNGSAPITATITVTPSFINNGLTCAGTPRTFTITVNPRPTVDPVNNQILCDRDNTAPVFFTSPVTGTTFTWTNNFTLIGLPLSGSGPIFSFVATNTTPDPYLATINVTPTFTSGGLSCTGPPRSFTIQVNPKPNVVLPPDQTVCNGSPSSPINLSGFVVGTVFNWTNSNPSIGLAATGTGSIPSFVATNPTAAPVIANITITPQNTIGGVTCTGFARTFRIIVNPTPIGVLATPVNTFICEGSSVTLTASGGATYQWFLNNVSIPGVSSATYAATQPGTYTVVPTSAAGCKGLTSNPITLTLINRPQPDFSFDKYCAGFPIQFTNLSQINGSGLVGYAWNFGDGGISGLTNPTHTYAQAGTYNVTLAATPVLCPALITTLTKAVTIIPPPPNIRYPSVNAVANRDLTLQARILAGAGYQWIPSTGLTNSNTQSPVFNFNQEQQYRIRIVTNEGCVLTDTLLVRMFPEREIYVAGGFTPNGDGKNDVIIPKLVGIKTLRYFKVYDRWGQLMYQTNIEGQGWDGKFKGIPQPLETYVWIAEGIDLDDKVVKRSGDFILFR